MIQKPPDRPTTSRAKPPSISGLDPAFRSEAFRRVMVRLAAKAPPGGARAEAGLSVPWAVRIAELAATYLAVLEVLTRAETDASAAVSLDEALTLTLSAWSAEGWRLAADDALTKVVVSLAQESSLAGSTDVPGLEERVLH